MKYHVQFQEFSASGHPVFHPGPADFETDGAGMIPNVGDNVQVFSGGDPVAPYFEGVVRSRLFTYHGNDKVCRVNIVVDPVDAEDRGAWEAQLVQE